jgi:transposase
LKNKVPISELCEKYRFHHNIFYNREKQFFEGGGGIFSRNHAPNETVKESAIVKKLEKKMHRKEEVIAYLNEEYIKLKKTSEDL